MCGFLKASQATGEANSTQHRLLSYVRQGYTCLSQALQGALAAVCLIASARVHDLKYGLVWCLIKQMITLAMFCCNEISLSLSWQSFPSLSPRQTQSKINDSIVVSASPNVFLWDEPEGVKPIYRPLRPLNRLQGEPEPGRDGTQPRGRYGNNSVRFTSPYTRRMCSPL